MFRKDQKVWCLIYGQGVVTEVDECFVSTHPVFVKFQNFGDDLRVSYTSDGKFHTRGNIVLFPHPVEVVKATTKPSIDWSHVSPEYNYLAQDMNGDGYLCGKQPSHHTSAWDMESPYLSATAFTSYVPGTCDWEDSLVKRPE